MTFLLTVQNAGLPIISVNEIDGSDPVFSRALTDAEAQLYGELKLQYYDPTKYNELLDDRANKQQIRDEYQATITQLQTIETTTSPTNAQVVAAVKFLAKTLRILLKFIVRAYVVNGNGVLRR